jgi:hypothetical protein
MLSEEQEKLDTIKRKVNKLYAKLPDNFKSSGALQRFLLKSENQSHLNRFLGANTYFEMLERFKPIEINIYRKLNRLVNDLDINVPLKDQHNKLKTMNIYFNFLKEYNITMASSCDYFLKEDTSGKYQAIKSILDHLETDKQQLSANEVAGKNAIDLFHSSINEEEFLINIKRFFLLSLVKSCSTEKGAEIIDKLAQVLDSKAFSLTIQTNYSLTQASLVAIPTRKGAYCRLQDENLHATEIPMQSLADYPIVKDEGAPSAFKAPVRAKDDEAYEQNYGIFFKDMDLVYSALNHSIIGSFSFDAQGTPFFTPAHIEVMHENLHVIDNAEGENRAFINPNDETWDNAAEYWAIAGGPLTENQLNSAYELPDRYGHHGIPIQVFLDYSQSDVTLKNYLPPNSVLLNANASTHTASQSSSSQIKPQT